MDKSKFTIFSFFLIVAVQVQAQFTESFVGEIVGMNQPSVEFGDFDNDGDMDLLITGNESGTGDPKTAIYENTPSGFIEVYDNTIVDIYNGWAHWIDLDNDEDLDIVLSGNDNSTPISKVYFNNGNGFTEGYQGQLYPMENSHISSGDFDNDGLRDILLLGQVNSTKYAYLYLNKGTHLELAEELFNYGIYANWADFDFDGDLDVAIGNYVFKNKDGKSLDYTYYLDNLLNGQVAWGSFTSSGYLDILISGTSKTSLYSFDGTDFNLETGDQLPETNFSSLEWLDFDQDGDDDVFITGYSSNVISRLYLREISNFQNDVNSAFEVIQDGDTDVCDLDNDGDLDIIISGNENGNWKSKIYLNEKSTSNSSPSEPTNLKMTKNGRIFNLTWDIPSDDHTSGTDITYNVRIGTTPGGIDIINPQSNSTTGKRLIQDNGNSYTNDSFFVKNLPIGTYYWSVQAIDGSLAASGWSQEVSFEVSSLFTEVFAGQILAVDQSTADWVDINMDGFLDLFITGNAEGNIASANLYENNNGLGFTENSTFIQNVPGLKNGAVYFGAIDPEYPFPDLILGDPETSISVFKYEDGQSQFRKMNISEFPFDQTLSSLDVLFADMNNDGDLEAIASGLDGTENTTWIFNYENGLFSEESSHGLQQSGGNMALTDKMNNSFTDVAQSGFDITNIYPTSSTAGAFSYNSGIAQTGYPGNYSGDIESADFNLDGFMDLVIVGTDNFNAGVFYFSNSGDNYDYGLMQNLDEFSSGKVEVADFDNDGDYDLLVTGENNSDGSALTRIYKFEAGQFIEDYPGIGINIKSGEFKWGDYDNDLDLDLIVTGYDETAGSSVSKIFMNNSNNNTAPSAPTSLEVEVITEFSKEFDKIILKWSPGTDLESPKQALTYELQMADENGYSLGEYNLIANSYDKNGNRFLRRPGNMLNDTTLVLGNLPYGTYYWRVATIDGSYASSPFSQEHSFMYEDTTDPVLSFTHENELFINLDENSHTLSGSVMDSHSGVQKLELRIRKITDDTWNTIGITVEENGSFGHILNLSDADEFGFVFNLTAFDNSNNSVISQDYYIYRLYNNAIVPNIKMGTKVADYNLFSVPFYTSEIDPNLFLPNEYNPREWRLFTYQSGSYREYGKDMSIVEMGKGYWYIQNIEHTPVFNNVGVFPLKNDNLFQQNFEPGWNLIGNPYPFTIEWQSVINSSSDPENVGNIYTYNEGFFATQTLAPFQAGFAFNNSNQNIVLTYPKTVRSSGGRTEQGFEGYQSEDNWLLTLGVESMGITNWIHTMGVQSKTNENSSSNLENGFPLFEGLAKLEFVHNEDRYMIDLRNPASELIWYLDMALEGSALLKWSQELTLKLKSELVLINLRNGTRYDMKKVDQAEIKGKGTIPLAIGYGSNRFLEEKLFQEMLWISSPYPNPMENGVELDIRFPENPYRHELNYTILDIQGRIVDKGTIRDIQEQNLRFMWNKPPDLKEGLYILRLKVFDGVNWTIKNFKIKS